MPTLTLGVQSMDVAGRFPVSEREAGLWQPFGGSGGYEFPLFGCPSCTKTLLLRPGLGVPGCDRLECQHCGWYYGGWIGTKTALPPILLTSLWLLPSHCTNGCRIRAYGRIFGDTPPFGAPRAVLADEIHLYSLSTGHRSGTRSSDSWAERESTTSTDRPPLAIGMSATLGSPHTVWGALCGRNEVEVIRPESLNDGLTQGPRILLFRSARSRVTRAGYRWSLHNHSSGHVSCPRHAQEDRVGRRIQRTGLPDSIDKVRRFTATTAMPRSTGSLPSTHLFIRG